MNKKSVDTNDLPSPIEKEKSRMRSYRFRTETIEALDCLTKAVNKKTNVKTNIKISATSILELLVLRAAKEDVENIVKLINEQEDYE